MRIFSAPEVAELAGITYRQIDYWTRIGALPESTTGTGNFRRFTFSDAVKAVAMAELVRAGMSPLAASGILTDAHRKTKCVRDFGATRITVDMRATRAYVLNLIEAHQ